MVFLLSLIQVLLILYISIREYKHKSPIVFLWATLLLMFGIMHFITPLMGSNFSDEVLNKASLFVIGFCILYLLTRKYLSFGRKDNHEIVFERNVGPKKKNHYFLVTLLLVVCAYQIIVISRSQGGLMNSSWSGGRDYLMSSDYFTLDSVVGLLYFLLGGVPFICVLNKEYKKFFLCLAAQFMVLLFTRNRVLMLPMVVSIISFFIFVFRAKIKGSTIVLAMIAAFGVIYFVYAFRAFRWLGTLNDALDNFSIASINETVNMFIRTDNGELGLRNVFYTFIENDNNYPDFNSMATYVRMLLVYVPTRFSGGMKPNDFAETMALAMGGTKGGSIHPTLFGDCYANAGMWGLFIGIIWGAIGNIVDYLIGHAKSIERSRLMYVLAGSSFVIIGRGAVYNGFVEIAWCFLIIFILSIFSVNRNGNMMRLRRGYEISNCGYIL